MTPLEVIGTDPDLLNALCRFFFDHLVKFLRVLRTIQYRSDEASTTINPFVCQLRPHELNHPSYYSF